jgi:hypothetical protein
MFRPCTTSRLHNAFACFTLNRAASHQQDAWGNIHFRPKRPPTQQLSPE